MIKDEQPYTVMIRTKSPKILGKYLDADIHETIETEDGRIFIFESIALTGTNGRYFIDFPQSAYMVFQNLLYRELEFE